MPFLLEDLRAIIPSPPVLAAARAETGNVDEAVKWQTKCLDESTPHARTELQERVRFYQARQAFRDQPPGVSPPRR